MVKGVPVCRSECVCRSLVVSLCVSVDVPTCVGLGGLESKGVCGLVTPRVSMSE